MKKILTILLLFPALCYSQISGGINGKISGSIQPSMQSKGFGIDTTIFYVSNSGDDSKDGHTPARAWQTIAKVNASSFDPGDQIKFKKGDAWRETLTVPSSGTVGDYITFTSYETGAKPQILGSELALNFVNVTGNIWGATNDLNDPFAGIDGEVFFVETDGSVTWGDNETWTANFSNLIAEYDWTWHGDTIYVYAASDPDTRYSAVEVPQRDNIIALNATDYIEINGLELRYAKQAGIFNSGYVAQTGLTVRNCNISYLSEKNDAGYGINAVYSDMLFEYDTIHDCGRRGISIYNYTSTNISNVIVQYCHFYSGWHTTGVDISMGSTAGSIGNCDSVIIRNNLFEDDPNRTWAEGHSEHCFNKGRFAGIGELRRIYYYNNVFKYPSSTSIQLEAVDTSFIYNNTFYGHNLTITGNTEHVSYLAACTKGTVKNNIFYTNLSFDTNGAGQCLYESATQDHTEIDADYNLYYRIADNLRVIVATGTNYYRTVASFDAMRAATGWETNSGYPADPTFTSATNYHLQTGSPAIGAGIAIAGYTHDYEGVAVSNPPNIGAFETTEDP